MPHVDGVLVFDASDADETGEYAIYSLPPSEPQEQLLQEWESLREGHTPTGRIPVSEVEIDKDKREIRVLTMGIERFAATAN